MSNKQQHYPDSNEGTKILSSKKTSFQRHKEELELRKKKETEEAAKIYDDFVASFETQNYTQGTSGFVRSSKDRAATSAQASPPATNTNSTYKPMSFVKAGDSIPKKAPVPSTTVISASKPSPSIAPIQKSNSKRGHHNLGDDDDDDDDDDDVLAQMKQSKASKKRHMDSFLEEIKKGQEHRTSGHESSTIASHESSISYDDGNTHTTNLFLADLHPEVNEDILCAEFGKYGPIASVKIMWPRTDDEVERQRNCGFVSFMTRSDAAAALDGINGKKIRGHTMKAGWGKPVALPAQPFFVLKKRDENHGLHNLPFNAKIVGRDQADQRREVVVIPPSDTNTAKIIHRLVERVVECGPLFEELIMEKEIKNPQYTFLFDNSHPDHIYYRWRLYSILQGDTCSSWRTDPFQMFDGGEWWIPPDIPDEPFDEEGTMELTLDSEDEANERTQQRLSKGQLGKIGRQRYEALLRKVTYQRGTIAQAMAFAIEHADAYEDIIEITFKSIIGQQASITSKIARLFLVSDILHNSSVHVTNAWRYRDGFQRRLPAVFEHLNMIYRSINARLKAEQFRRYVTAVLGAWENWMVFPGHFITKLDGIFVQKLGHELSSDQVSKYADRLAGNDMDKQSSGTLQDDIDGEKMGDIDGEAMDDIDGEAMDDIDGEAMDDIDGVEL